LSLVRIIKTKSF